MATFDVRGARAAGYSDAEIQQFLSSRRNSANAQPPANTSASAAVPVSATSNPNFDYSAAKAAGYSDDEIRVYLGNSPAPVTSPPSTAGDITQLSDAELLALKRQQDLAAIPTEHLQAALASPPWEKYGGKATGGPWENYAPQPPPATVLDRRTRKPSSSGGPMPSNLPPLPAGFTLDGAPSSMPPLPPGFKLDSDQPATVADRVQATEGGILKGGAYLAGMLPDAVANLGGLAVSGYDAARHAMGTDWADLPRPWQPNPVGAWISRQMDRSPITTTQPTRPDDAVSRYLATAGSVVPGGVAGGGGAVGPALRAIAGAVPSAFAGQAVMEGRPFQSNAANTTASVLAQALAGYATPAAAKLAIRGPSTAPVQANVSAFRQAGAEPSLAQAAGTRRMQFFESGLSKIPGGSGVLAKSAARQAQALRGGVDETVDALAPGGASPERAGRAITQGVVGEGGFRDQFNATAGDLYGKVDQHIAPDVPVSVTSTLGTLDAIAKPSAAAPATSAALVNPKVAAIRQALLSDLGTQGSSLPYSTLSELRSRVGEMLTGSELTTDIPRAQVKRLYGALSSDLKTAAQQAGPDAAQAFSRASNYYNAGMKRMDVLADVLERNGGSEQVFNGAMAGTKDGATRLRAVLQSLAPEQQRVVAATVFKRMGQATPGNQSAAGDVFSPETFLTNYNRMSSEAKSALFDRVPELRDQADNVAAVAENLRSGSKVFRNASGTGAAEAQTHTLRDLLIGSLMGGEGLAHFGPEGLAQYGPHLLAAGVGVPLTANLLARGITSPTVVNWAARPAAGSASQFASALSMAPNVRDDRWRLINALQASGLRQGGQ